MANLLGPVVGGLILLLHGVLGWGLPVSLGLAVLLDALTFGMAGLVLLLVRVPDHARQHQDAQHPLQDLSQAWTFMRAQPGLLWLLLLVSLVGMVYSPIAVTLPLLTRHQLSGLEYTTGYAVMNFCVALGGVLGMLWMQKFAGRARGLWQQLGMPMALMGVALLVLASSTGLWTAVPGVVLLTAMPMLFGSHHLALWQQVTPPGLQGRVMGFLRLAGQVSMPLATLLAGWLIGQLGSPGFFAGSGALVLLLVLLFAPVLSGGSSSTHKGPADGASPNGLH